MNEFAAYYQQVVKADKNKRYENQLFEQIKSFGLKEPVREFKFHQTRKWRFDFAYPEIRLAVEVEGGIWSGGRHTRGAGFEGDCEKYNEAAVDGWRVVRLTPKMVADLRGVNCIKRILGNGQRLQE